MVYNTISKFCTKHRGKTWFEAACHVITISIGIGLTQTPFIRRLNGDEPKEWKGFARDNRVKEMSWAGKGRKPLKGSDCCCKCHFTKESGAGQG